MRKNVKKVLFITLIILFFSIVCNCNDLNAKGLVSQGWYNSGEFHFITLTAPHPSTVKKYGTSGYFTKESDEIDIGAGTTFYNSETRAINTSYWVNFSANKAQLSGEPSKKGEFSTYRLSFHKNRMANYGGSCSDRGSQSCYKYATMSGSNPFSDIGSLKNAYSNIHNDNSTTYAAIGNNSSYSEVLGIDEGASTSSLYRMTLADRGDDLPVFVAERKISSGNVSTLKKNLEEITENGNSIKNAIFVSSMLHVNTYQGRTVIESANNPKAFMALGIKTSEQDNKVTWQPGTRGWSDKLGSALNLYDNILQFPTAAKRRIIVKHINIGSYATITTDNVAGGTFHIQGPDTIEVDQSPTYNAGEYGTYMGYNIGISSTPESAKNAVDSQVANSHIMYDKSHIQCKVSASSSPAATNVYIEMYYNDGTQQPPNEPEAPKEETTVVERHIVYSSLGEIKSTEETTYTIAAGQTQTCYSKNSLGTYLGYIIKDNDSTIPAKEDCGTSNTLVTVTAGQEGSTIYVNFGYESSDTIPIVVRDIYYSSNSVYLSSSMRNVENINSSDSPKTFSRKPNSELPSGYEYVGYLIAYDKDIPSCDAYVEPDSCTISFKDIRKKIYINFMYKETQSTTPVPHDAPNPIINGYLGIRAFSSTIKTNCVNTTGSFPKYSGSDVLSVASGQSIDIGMEKLNKYYIGAINVDKKIEENNDGLVKRIAFLKLVLVHDVNTNKVENFALGLENFKFIIPYKFITYKIKDFSVYKLNTSDIYVPGQDDAAKGPKIIENIERKIFYDIIKASDVSLELVSGRVIDPIKLNNIEVYSTLVGGTPVTDLNNVIHDSENNAVTNIKESEIRGLSLDVGNITSLLGSLVTGAGYSGTDSDLNNGIGTILTGISSLTTDGYIIETVHAYTNDSDDETINQVFWQWLLCSFGQISDATCPDVADVWSALVNFVDSKNKTGIFIYTGYDSNGTEKNVSKTVDSIVGFIGLGYKTLSELDNIRQINTKLELSTNESVSFLKLKYPSEPDGVTIGQSITLATLADQIVDNIFTKDMSIWDINFTKKKEGIITTEYKFNGYVNLFTAASGMRINSKGKKYYTEGFGGDIGELDTSGSIANKITYDFSKDKLADQEITLEKLNGIRSLAEKTTYTAKDIIKEDTDNIDNLYYSNLNLLGIKNIFKFEGIDQTKEHNSDEKTTDLINVYTPIEIDENFDIESDDKLISQLTDKTSIPSVFFNSEFSFKIGAGIYGTNGIYSALRTKNLKDYCEGFYVKFSFDVEYIKLKNALGTEIKLDNIQKDRYKYLSLDEYPLDVATGKLKITVKALNEISGSVTITVRAVAKNALTNSEIKSNIGLLDYSEFFDMYNNICNDISRDISKVDAPIYFDEKEFEISSNNISRLYDFRVTDVKDVNWKKIFRSSTSSTSHNGTAYYVGLKKWDIIKGMVTRTESEVGKYLNRTLPIGPYKSTDGSYIAAPKIGYRIAFDVKKSYPEEGENTKKDVKIDTSFFYVKKDGTGLTSDIDLYYKNSSGNYVKVGSSDDSYKITFTPNEETRLIDMGDTGNLSTSTIELGTLKQLNLTYSGMSTKSSDHQTFYGEYKLPNSTIVVRRGESPKDKSNILSNGYLGVKFEILSYFKFAGEPTDREISYQIDMNDSKTGTNEWLYEGYMGQKYGSGTITKQLQLEKGRLTINATSYSNIEGTVVLFDLDNRAASDYD